MGVISCLGAVWIAVAVHDRVLGGGGLGAATGGAAADGEYSANCDSVVDSGQFLGDRFFWFMASTARVGNRDRRRNRAGRHRLS